MHSKFKRKTQTISLINYEQTPEYDKILVFTQKTVKLLKMAIFYFYSPNIILTRELSLKNYLVALVKSKWV